MWYLPLIGDRISAKTTFNRRVGFQFTASRAFLSDSVFMAILRVKARWTIPGAGTAFSVLHFGNNGIEDPTDTQASNSVGATRTFFEAIKAFLPAPVIIDYMTDVEVIDILTGNLEGVRSAASVAQTVGGASGSANWVAPAGACITWSTAGLRTVNSKPRRVRGRTFIVPLASVAYDPNGNLSVSALTALNTGATGLRGNFNGQEFGIYGRPGPGGSPAGVYHLVTGHRITDQAAVLRSRRS